MVGPAISNLSVMLLMAGIVLLHAGGFLLRMGWWPRRVGRAPYCGRCAYMLVGLVDSPRCPECGQFLSPRTIDLGERRRRPKLAAAGVILALLGLAVTFLSLSDAVRGAR